MGAGEGADDPTDPGGASGVPDKPQLIIAKDRWGRSFHQYRYRDEIYPSVTGILDVLKNWAIVNAAAKEVAYAAVKSRKQIYAIVEGAGEEGEGAAVEILKGAHWKAWNAKRDRGINVHALIASDTPPTEAEAAYVDQYQRWLSDSGAEIIDQEVEVVSVIHGYGGKIDLDARVNGAVTTVDLKVRDDLRVFPERMLQVVAYAEAEVGHPEPVERAAILTLGYDDYSYVEVERTPAAVEAFKGLMAYRTWLGGEDV